MADSAPQLSNANTVDTTGETVTGAHNVTVFKTRRKASGEVIANATNGFTGNTSEFSTPEKVARKR